MKEPDSSGDRKKRVPVVFVSGDDKACNEAKRLIKGVYTVETKIGMGREAAILNPVVKVREEITEYGRSPEENLLAPERSSTNRNP
ncbi:MAG: M55 family metallopeptidase [Candidatus Firestonebacteria bacterium]|nr:M55 family metallopeptidase [Candidatus Firestonebacteria bacterium]